MAKIADPLCVNWSWHRFSWYCRNSNIQENLWYLSYQSPLLPLPSLLRKQESLQALCHTPPFSSGESESELEQVTSHHFSHAPYGAHYQLGTLQSYPPSVPQLPWYAQPWALPLAPIPPPCMPSLGGIQISRFPSIQQDPP